MGKIKKIGYSLKDISVVQAPISYQLHRGDVNPFVETCGRETYPIFVAPMAAVTDENNYKLWIENKLTPVVPRSVQGNLSITERLDIATETFVSFSLSEITEMYNDNIFETYLSNGVKIFVCIDIAHGTLSSLYEICSLLKSKYDDRIIIMTGNIATPEAYIEYCKRGIDYVRISVGSGSRCTSACNTSIYYPMATLLDEINEIRKTLDFNSNNLLKETKVIADGGIGWFDDIQKALVLGADYVMIGKMFAECEEACSPIIYLHKDKPSVIDAISKEDYDEKLSLMNSELNTAIDRGDNNKVSEIQAAIANLRKRLPYRNYFGMSCKIAQKITGGDGSKTAEGISKPVEVKYPVSKLMSNMESYLRSCMTYTNSKNIYDLKNAEVIILGGSGDFAYRK